MLKEEITANTIQKVIRIQAIHPVRNVSQAREDRGAYDEAQTFQQVLASTAAKKAARSGSSQTSPQQVLEMMGGTNHYDRNAKEIFFAMSSNTDFTC
jgi:hypothetical protein